jgi:hypothetical protein
MSAKDELLRMFDDAWGHPDESLLTALDKLTVDEAQWQHAAYAAERAFPSMPPPGTVLWQIAHLEHSARHYAELIRQRPLSEEPITPPPSTHILEDLLTALHQAHAHFREVIAELAENDVNQPCARGMNVAEFIRMAVRHSTWHASQIATVRRLYRYQCC